MPELFDSTKRCLNCQSYLKGRSDRKFCSLKCKNNWHNTKNSQNSRLFRTVDNQLHKNREILREHYDLTGGAGFVPVLPLYRQGFIQDFFTGSIYLDETGEKFSVVYDFAFLVNHQNEIKILHAKEGFQSVCAY